MNYSGNARATKRTNLVLDKSYLQGYGKEFILKQAKLYKFLFSNTLTFEVAKDNVMRANLFGKIPPPPRCSAYIPSVARLIQSEIKSLEECGKPSEHGLQYDYSSLPRLSNPNIPLSDLQVEAINKEKEFSEKLLNEGIILLLGEVFDKYTKEQIADELAELSRGKINDFAFINNYLIAQRKAGANIPNMSCFTIKSITYRYYQVLIMFIFDTCKRYQNLSVIQNSEGALEKLRHDINDMSYLMLGLLEGGFAVREKKLVAFWRLLKGHDVPESNLQT